mmetsp:Transcript_39348/g.93237  ORF Transcript_39348/g.93237 Transcript_39348/m.93237 type:complete len:315 (-) Transcript_39348:1403-2347(-)
MERGHQRDLRRGRRLRGWCRGSPRRRRSRVSPRVHNGGQPRRGADDVSLREARPLGQEALPAQRRLPVVEPCDMGGARRRRGIAGRGRGRQPLQRWARASPGRRHACCGPPSPGPPPLPSGRVAPPSAAQGGDPAARWGHGDAQHARLPARIPGNELLEAAFKPRRSRQEPRPGERQHGQREGGAAGNRCQARGPRGAAHGQRPQPSELGLEAAAWQEASGGQPPSEPQPQRPLRSRDYVGSSVGAQAGPIGVGREAAQGTRVDGVQPQPPRAGAVRGAHLQPDASPVPGWERGPWAAVEQRLRDARRAAGSAY